MDGLTLAGSVFEMQSLVGGKIEKIQQPEKNELLFSVHTTNGSRRLIISSSSDNCRIHITAEKRTSPLDAPNFLMVLRKHLLGSRIVSIEQPNLDRIVFIRFSALTELSDITELTLACEIMGRHSNIILIDKNGIIIDSIRHVPAGMSSVRLVLPRIEYAVPPVQEKLDPLGCSSDTFAKLILGSQRPDKALSSAVYGLSPAVASLLLQAVSAAATDAPDDNEYYLNADNCAAVGKRLCLFYKDLAACKTTPCIASLGDKSVLLPFVPYGLIHTDYSAVSEAADSYYRLRSEAESAHRRTASIGHILETNIQRLEKRAERFALSIGDEAEIEKLRLNGELITANLYALPERTDSAACMNYYLDPPATVVIPLDPKLTVSANAQLYYKKYRKAKAAREYALSKRDETLAEIDYLYSVSSDLEKCSTDSDFEEVKDELIAAGYIRQERKKRIKLPPTMPHRYISEEGIEILVGKNNTQNDRLTFKVSSPNDIWLHTKDIHGSHVIIRSGGAQVPDNTLLMAASLAAYYSKGRNIPACPVDYTVRKNVKKPNGSKPGMVIYTGQKTVYVKPDPYQSLRK